MNRTTTLALLFLSFAWGVISFGYGIKTLMRLTDTGSRINLFSTALVITTVSGLIFLTSLSAIAHILTATRATRATRAAREEDIHSAGHRGIGRTLAHILGFLTLWLFATSIPYTHYTRKYNLDGIRWILLLAIFPWLTFLFSLLATLALWMFAKYHRNWNPLGVHPDEKRNSSAPLSSSHA